MNGTDVLGSQQTLIEQDALDDPPFSNVLEPNSDTTLFEQELLAGYTDYQSLVNSLDNQATLELFESDIMLDETAALDSIVTVPTKEAFSIFDLSDVWKARLLLLLSAALYGTNFTFVKSLDESMSVGLSSTLRFGFAALVMLPWLFAPLGEEAKALARERNDGESTDGEGNALLKFVEDPMRVGAVLAGMEIGVYNSIGYIAQAVGLKTTCASKSAFICSLAVVTVPILDYMWGKPLLRRQVAGACLAAFGVYALELGGEATSITEGDMLSLVQPLLFGLGFWRMEAAVEKYPTEAARLAAAQLLVVFGVSVSYLLLSSGDGALLSWGGASEAVPTAPEILARLRDPSVLGMLFWTGVVTTALTIWMETLALKTLSAAETTLIFSTEPLFGAAFAAAVAGECLGQEAAVGAAFIIGGCIVSGVDVGRLFRRDGIDDVDVKP